MDLGPYTFSFPFSVLHRSPWGKVLTVQGKQTGETPPTPPVNPATMMTTVYWSRHFPAVPPLSAAKPWLSSGSVLNNDFHCELFAFPQTHYVCIVQKFASTFCHGHRTWFCSFVLLPRTSPSPSPSTSPSGFCLASIRKYFQLLC